jgi:hypothetical protein
MYASQFSCLAIHFLRFGVTPNIRKKGRVRFVPFAFSWLELYTVEVCFLRLLNPSLREVRERQTDACRMRLFDLERLRED